MGKEEGRTYGLSHPRCSAQTSPISILAIIAAFVDLGLSHHQGTFFDVGPAFHFCIPRIQQP